MEEIIYSSDTILDIIKRLNNNKLVLVDKSDNSKIIMDDKLKENIIEYYSNKLREL